MMGKVLFHNPSIYLGETKERRCIGIEAFLTMMGRQEVVLLQPLNERGGEGKCYIGIPKEHIQDLIEVLEKLKQ